MGQLSGLPSLERRRQPDDDELATDDSAELEVNLGLILKQSQDIFDSEGSGKPFGLDGFYLQESPFFSDFNNLFKRRPSQPTRKSPAKEEIGEFASLGTGEPWDKFRNIFLLYGKPQQEGHVEIFGPVYGENQGCGLCNLFPKFEVADFVTLELISEPVQTTTTYQEHEVNIILTINNSLISLYDIAVTRGSGFPSQWDLYPSPR